jgi:hypothetical protein
MLAEDASLVEETLEQARAMGASGGALQVEFIFDPYPITYSLSNP